MRQTDGGPPANKDHAHSLAGNFEPPNQESENKAGEDSETDFEGQASRASGRSHQHTRV